MVPLSRLSGATPTRLKMGLPLRFPSFDHWPANVACVTGPTPFIVVSGASEGCAPHRLDHGRVNRRQLALEHAQARPRATADHFVRADFQQLLFARHRAAQVSVSPYAQQAEGSPHELCLIFARATSGNCSSVIGEIPARRAFLSLGRQDPGDETVDPADSRHLQCHFFQRQGDARRTITMCKASGRGRGKAWLAPPTAKRGSRPAASPAAAGAAPAPGCRSTTGRPRCRATAAPSPTRW